MIIKHIDDLNFIIKHLPYGKATLAQYLGVSRATIHNWLHGEGPTRVKHEKLLMELREFAEKLNSEKKLTFTQALKEHKGLRDADEAVTFLPELQKIDTRSDVTTSEISYLDYSEKPKRLTNSPRRDNDITQIILDKIEKRYSNFHVEREKRVDLFVYDHDGKIIKLIQVKLSPVDPGHIGKLIAALAHLDHKLSKKDLELHLFGPSFSQDVIDTADFLSRNSRIRIRLSSFGEIIHIE